MGECICCFQEASERNPNPVFALRQCHFFHSGCHRYQDLFNRTLKMFQPTSALKLAFEGWKQAHEFTITLSSCPGLTAEMQWWCVFVCRQWEDAEIMVLLQFMYTDLDFISTFNIEPEVLQQFLFEVYRRYNNIPFHNFKHCFCVTQMVSVCVCVCVRVVFHQGKPWRLHLQLQSWGHVISSGPSWQPAEGRFQSPLGSPENCCCSNLLLTSWSIVSPPFLRRCMAWSGWLTWGVRWTASTCSSCWPLPFVTTLTTQDTTMPIR